MATFVVQYLEASPKVAAIPPSEARARLRAAFQRLPISSVLIGWDLPRATLDACRNEVTRGGAQLYRWHPLLTGDGTFFPRNEWRAIGLGGEPVPGFRGLPEFTFVCPNRPAVRTAVLDRLREVIEKGVYDGVFLDRMRTPSPASDPGRWLACFCDDCHRAAAQGGLDLELIRRRIARLFESGTPPLLLLQNLLGTRIPEPDDPLSAFLDFRARSVSKLVQAAADLIHARGLSVGLDCFSPVLAQMVGQDLGELDACAEWTKVMTYGHALGPATLPYELLELAAWLIEQHSASERQALNWLSRASGLSLPQDREGFRAQGLRPDALGGEIERARTAGVKHLLAGIELVEIEGVARLDPAQIQTDIRAFRRAGADGLALSWDLWHIPLERLDLVRSIWSQ
jgi:hypothetical protein